MFPIVAFAAVAALLAWAARPKKTGVGTAIGLDAAASPRALPAVKPEILQPPLAPEAERLLALLVLYARDRKYPAGQKRYLSPNTALEAVQLSRRLGLPKTAMAIRKDGPLPADEFLPGRTANIRQSVVSYGTTGRA